MKLPRDLSGEHLIVILSRFGFERVHQTGSHVRLVRKNTHEHHITVPMSTPMRIGTLEHILKDISKDLGISIEDILGIPEEHGNSPHGHP
jgi:predicted RNA binding protein YcfA (HicA-like mRNA interferase family)